MKYLAILRYPLFCISFNFFYGILYIMEVGDKLNPQRSYRKGFALKGLRQHIIKTNNPSTIGPDELLTVRFPNLKENQVIIPGTTKLTFNITLVGTDVNRNLVFIL